MPNLAIAFIIAFALLSVGLLVFLRKTQLKLFSTTEQLARVSCEHMHLVAQLDDFWHCQVPFRQLPLTEEERAMASIFGQKYEETFPCSGAARGPEDSEMRRASLELDALISRCADQHIVSAWKMNGLRASNSILQHLLVKGIAQRLSAQVIPSYEQVLTAFDRERIENPDSDHRLRRAKHVYAAVADLLGKDPVLLHSRNLSRQTPLPILWDAYRYGIEYSDEHGHWPESHMRTKEYFETMLPGFRTEERLTSSLQIPMVCFEHHGYNCNNIYHVVFKTEKQFENNQDESFLEAARSAQPVIEA